MATGDSIGRRSIGRPFRLVWWSVVVSSSGDGMFVTAFPLLAATLTGDPLLIAGVTIASRLPWLLFSMVTGAIADRMDRRRLMIGADLARVAVVGALGVMIALDVANIWMLLGCAFLLGIGETLHVNSAQALLPSIVPPSHLMEANASFSGAQVATAQFIGPPLGSVLFDTVAALPFLADAVSFAGSAALVLATPDVHAVERPATRLRDDVREGFRFGLRDPALRRLTVVLAVINFFYFAAAALLVLYNRDLLHAGEYTYTAMLVAIALGTVVSRWLVAAVTARFGPGGAFTVAFWLWAVGLGGIALTSSGPVAVALFGVVGVGNGLWIVLNTTLRQKLAPPSLLGRMNALYRTISWGVVPFGALFGGWLARVTTLRTPFVVCGIVQVLIAVFARRLLRPIIAAEAVW